jgi:alpha-L-fucosidase 2
MRIPILRSGADIAAACYPSQVEVIHEGGKIAVDGERIGFTGCDAVTLVLGAGTSYVIDAARRVNGEHPLARVTGQVTGAAARPWTALRAEHERDLVGLLGRVTLDLGQAPAARRALPTDARLKAYTEERGEQTGEQGDPELEAQLFQYGR